MFRRHHEIPAKDGEDHVLLGSHIPNNPASPRGKYPHPSSLKMRSVSPTVMPDSSKGASDEIERDDKLEHVEIHRNETLHDAVVGNLLSKQQPPRQNRHTAADGNSELASSLDPKSNSLSSGLPSPIFPAGPEDMFDPFTGVVIGKLHSKAADGAPGDGSANVEEGVSASWEDSSRISHGDNDTMWTQLTKIRQLQSEVAKLHMAMDGSGLESGSKKSEGKRPFAKGIGDPLDASIKQPSEDEFIFRKDNISNIMGKVCSVRLSRNEMFLFNIEIE